MAGLPEDTRDRRDILALGNELERSRLVEPSIYVPSPQTTNEPLRQGEILSNVVQLCLDVQALRRGEFVANPIIHPFAVILTQDCDCEQDFNSRRDKAIGISPSLLFGEIAAADEVAGAGNSGGINSAIRGRIKINKDERYHFFETISAKDDGLGEGLPELICDFKRYFTIPTDEIYYRVESAETKRRCRLVSPYLEHLAVRFGYFSQRVALPFDHAST